MADHVTPHHPGAHEEVFPGLGHDPYALREKLSEPTICRDCGAVYHEGRWQWLARPAQAKETLCMACRRIADALPAGYVYIDGPFAAAHLVEILERIRHHEAHAKREHPMQRIMSVDENGGTTIVSTTDVHLARGIGAALESAFQGSLVMKYSPDEYLVRIYWRR
ncbi:BCAM0308 family protein [Trinickia caryophylli]|uniref:NMD3 family protein n=1 Tax=Trinickia caryophylli TaxID=28094 RepID=A0A1X7D1Y7_TRICW|nr:BCAM0308 family protein [Trinickia caryophylli]PMS13564.1 ATPase [Trinickia caryophylli]TRX15268.1 ATPase [Trinickia caryophylli]WQE15144.1 BCAM0308 family protein [Trinickia caryophylli]SMF06658.1 hypothetical protein SAMN06295900_102241 [Trinickia caryophylli]GLU31118.1 hypothetical protein Busp01_09600 [Trinickia caryophylli]